jgi:hypothetical protein
MIGVREAGGFADAAGSSTAGGALEYALITLGPDGTAFALSGRSGGPRSSIAAPTTTIASTAIAEAISRPRGRRLFSETLIIVLP